MISWRISDIALAAREKRDQKYKSAVERQAMKEGIPEDKVWSLIEEARMSFLPNQQPTMYDCILKARDIWRNREMTIDEGI